MSSVETSDQPPAYNQLNEPNDQLKSTDENQHNQYPGSNQYPSPGGAQYPGNQYQPQAVPLVITQPGVVPMDAKRAPQARDWMVPAVLSCLCCFWPTGICAIMAANNKMVSEIDSSNIFYNSKNTRVMIFFLAGEQPVYNQNADQNDQVTFIYGYPFDHYPEGHQFPPPVCAQYQINRYQSEYNPQGDYIWETSDHLGWKRLPWPNKMTYIKVKVNVIWKSVNE
uniref:Uncharacterized protein n=1 Tax=Magallana gigas TaxID=29159 RepID=K1Q7R3_MAGGI